VSVALIEPSCRSKFPPLGLLRLSTCHKSRGDRVRFVQCVLLATRGLVSPNPEFIRGAFGETYEEFLEILSMPDRYILYREHYRDDGAGVKWRTRFASSRRCCFVEMAPMRPMMAEIEHAVDALPPEQELMLFLAACSVSRARACLNPASSLAGKSKHGSPKTKSCRHEAFDLPAFVPYAAGMKSGNPVQYTLRQVPARVDRSLRQKSKQSGQSLNEAAIEALAKGLGLAEERMRFHDLDPLAGTWEEDPAFDAAIEAQDQIERRLWK